MKKIDTARALRDAEYRATLTAAERAALPAHPVGITAIADEALESVTGGCFPSTPSMSCVPPGMYCP